METLLNTEGLSPVQLVVRARSNHEQLEGNSHFVLTQPTLAEYMAGIKASSEALLAIEAAKSALAQARQASKLANKGLKRLMRLMAAQVENQSGGNPEKILTSGFGARSHKAAQGKAELSVELRYVRTTDVEGQLRVRVKAIESARFYEVYVTTTPENPASWKCYLTDHRALMLLEGLKSGTKAFVKVRAKLPNGYSGFSSEMGRKVF